VRPAGASASGWQVRGKPRASSSSGWGSWWRAKGPATRSSTGRRVRRPVVLSGVGLAVEAEQLRVRVGSAQEQIEQEVGGHPAEGDAVAPVAQREVAVGEL